MNKFIHQYPFPLPLLLIAFLLFPFSTAHFKLYTTPSPVPEDTSQLCCPCTQSSPKAEHKSQHTQSSKAEHKSQHTESSPKAEHKSQHTQSSPKAEHKSQHSQSSSKAEHKSQHTQSSSKAEHKSQHTQSSSKAGHKSQHTQSSPKAEHKSQHTQSSHKASSSVSVDSSLKGVFTKVFAFGDSDTDTGNAALLGEQGMHMESSFETNISFDINKSLIVDFLCKSMGLPPIQPFLKAGVDSSAGVSFATGSTSLSSELFIKKNMSSLFWQGPPQSFMTQIDWFKEYLVKAGIGNGKTSKGGKGSARGATLDLSSALFWIGQMGVSDYSSAAGSSISFDKLAQLSVQHVMELVTEITLNGGKSIVVQGLPPIGCCPLFLSFTSKLNLDPSGCMQPINMAIMAHNKILQMALENFRKEHPDCIILYADCWSAYMEIISHPEKYGMEEPFKACCGSGDGEFNFNQKKTCGAPGTTVCKDPNKYVNWDGLHLTGGMHKLLTDMFLHKGYCQPSFYELVKMKTKKIG